MRRLIFSVTSRRRSPSTVYLPTSERRVSSSSLDSSWILVFGASPANPEDIGQRDRRMLVVRDIDACNTGHQLTPKFERLARWVIYKRRNSIPLYPGKGKRHAGAGPSQCQGISPDAACAAARCR